MENVEDLFKYIESLENAIEDMCKSRSKAISHKDDAKCREEIMMRFPMPQGIDWRKTKRIN